MVRGVDGVSIKELAAHAGISDGAMYRYYPSKYNLAHTLMLAIHNKLTKLVRDVENGEGKFRAKIKNLVTNYCAAADDDWQLFSYHLLHLHHFPELFTKGPGKRKKLDSPVTACADMLETAMTAGDIPNGNTELLASMALGVVIQGASAKSYGRLSGPLSIYAPEFERRHLGNYQTEIGYPMRSLIFNILFYILTAVFAIACVILSFLPTRKPIMLGLAAYTKTMIWLMKIVAGIEVRVSGHERLPAKGPYIIAPKHQSYGDGFVMFSQFFDLSFVTGDHLEKFMTIKRILQKAGAVVVDSCGGSDARDSLQKRAALVRNKGVNS